MSRAAFSVQKPSLRERMDLVARNQSKQDGSAGHLGIGIVPGVAMKTRFGLPVPHEIHERFLVGSEKVEVEGVDAVDGGGEDAGAGAHPPARVELQSVVSDRAGVQSVAGGVCVEVNVLVSLLRLLRIHLP